MLPAINHRFPERRRKRTVGDVGKLANSFGVVDRADTYS